MLGMLRLCTGMPLSIASHLVGFFLDLKVHLLFTTYTDYCNLLPHFCCEALDNDSVCRTLGANVWCMC